MRFLVFGFERDKVPDADVIFDCRILNDPQRHPQYKQLTGADPEIQQYVRRSAMFGMLFGYVLTVLRGMPYNSVVAFGCAFGKHRSRAVAHLAREVLVAEGAPIEDIAPYVWLNRRGGA